MQTRRIGAHGSAGAHAVSNSRHLIALLLPTRRMCSLTCGQRIEDMTQCSFAQHMLRISDVLMFLAVAGISGGRLYITATTIVHMTVVPLKAQPQRPILKWPRRGRNRDSRWRHINNAAGKAKDNCSTRTPVPQRLLNAVSPMSNRFVD